MRYFIIIVLTIIMSGCDDSGKQEWQVPPTPSKTDTVETNTIVMNSDSIDEPVAMQNMELRINLAQIAGAGAPTRVVVTADLEEGEIVGYAVTTSARKKSKPPVEKPDACVSCYVIQKNDTKSGLARRFNISQSQIKNKNLIIGQKLIVE